MQALSPKMIATLQALRIAGTLGLSLSNLPCESGTLTALKKRELVTHEVKRFDSRVFITAEGVVALVRLGHVHAVDLAAVRDAIVEVLQKGGELLRRGWQHDSRILFRCIDWDAGLPWKASQSLAIWANENHRNWFGLEEDARRTLIRQLAKAVEVIVNEAFGRASVHSAAEHLAAALRIVEEHERSIAAAATATAAPATA